MSEQPEPGDKTSEPENKPGIVLGMCLLGLFMTLMIIATPGCLDAFARSHGYALKHGVEDAVIGLYLMDAGLMYLLSYYFSHKTFFLRWVRWSCENARVRGLGVPYNFSRKLGRKTASFLFAAILGGMGTIYLLIGIS